jgi:dTDP-4-amino-4,6-dideoxygalactose transaminase
VPEPGYKYNMFDIQAGLLLHQLKTIRKNTAVRKRLYERFANAIGPMPGFRLPAVRYGRSCYHLLTVQTDPRKRDQAIESLNRQGIPVSVHFHPVHLFSHYRKTYGFKKGDFPNAERIGFSAITLPFHPFMTPYEFRTVVSGLKETSRFLS